MKDFHSIHFDFFTFLQIKNHRKCANMLYMCSDAAVDKNTSVEGQNFSFLRTFPFCAVTLHNDKTYNHFPIVTARKRPIHTVHNLEKFLLGKLNLESPFGNKNNFEITTFFY